METNRSDWLTPLTNKFNSMCAKKEKNFNTLKICNVMNLAITFFLISLKVMQLLVHINHTRQIDYLPYGLDS